MKLVSPLEFLPTSHPRVLLETETDAVDQWFPAGNLTKALIQVAGMGESTSISQNSDDDTLPQVT
jgi:hypothetical protein